SAGTRGCQPAGSMPVSTVLIGETGRVWDASSPSVPDFNAAHNRHAFHDQALGGLGTFARFQTVSAHERRDSHRHGPCFGNANHSAAHESVHVDDGLTALDVRIPPIDVKSALARDQIAAPKVLGANSVFSPAPNREHVKLG